MSFVDVYGTDSLGTKQFRCPEDFMNRRKFVSGLKMMRPKHLIENGVNSNKLT